MSGKRGAILIGNIVFIILNLVFLSILILFLFTRTGSAAILEEGYAKQIALMIDSAEPGMIIHINMEDAIEEAEKNNFTENIVSINQSRVNVRLSEKGGYSYHFFNDLAVNVYPDVSSNPVKEYVLVVNEKN